MSLPTTIPTDTTSPIRVLVLGKLGELVKKIYELEYLILHRPNPITAAELASYNMVLASWPVDNTDETELLVVIFKKQLNKFHQSEAHFNRAVKSKNELEVTQCSAEYVAALEEVKATMKKLNSVGKHVGDSIWLEIKP